MPQPGPAPMPQQAPYGQPAPQPYQQQPYYQQPMPQAPVANKAPLTPLQFVRSLILNIGALLIYFLMILPFVVPLIKGSSDNFFVLFGQLFNFDGVTNFAITIQVFNIFAFFLPLIGFLAYGTMALVSAIKGLVNKSLPRFEFLGFGLGMYAPMFLVACASANVANDIVGFKFIVFDSPAFLKRRVDKQGGTAQQVPLLVFGDTAQEPDRIGNPEGLHQRFQLSTIIATTSHFQNNSWNKFL